MQRSDEHLEIRLARDDVDLRAAQRLRYRVFVQEMGAGGELVDHGGELETDRFDAHCQHLILVDKRRDSGSLDHVVGVYRMLDRAAAARTGGFYSQAEYDLSPLTDGNRTLLELGRSCVHPDYRNGMALFMLWHGLGAHVAQNGTEVLFGVASFAGRDAGEFATPLGYLHHHHLAPPDLRVRSLARSGPILPAEQIDRASAMAAMPALIKAYLRIGGFVGDGAFVDRGFNTTDVCLILDTARMGARQRRLYGGAV